ncbi:MAG: MFS transporter [Myxococcales bacterium]|nr:MFS transporter [Myxococcales bacterium]
MSNLSAALTPATAVVGERARPAMVTAMCAALQGVGGGLGWSLLPPLMPAIAADLSISHELGGLVWGAAPLGIALASPLGGAAVDRFGPRRVAGLAMLAGAAACASRALVESGGALAAAMFLFGLHVGFVAPSIPKALAGHVPLGRLGRANGLALLAYTAGTALTVLLSRSVLAPALGGWRPTMVVAAIAMAVAGALWMALVRDRIALSRHAGLGQVLSLARNRPLLRVAAMHFLLFGGYLAMLGILQRSLVESGMAAGAAGIAVASWLLVAAFANFLGPTLSDRLGRRRPFLLAGSLLAGGALLALALLPPMSAVWLLAVAALGGGSFAPLLLALPLELPGVGPAKAGGALGLLMLVGQVGGFLLPVATGLFAGRGGFQAALALLAVTHLAIVLPAWGLPETGTAAKKAAESGPARLAA